MAVIYTDSANDPIDMSDPLLVDFGGALVAEPDSFSWFTTFAFPPVADVDFTGSDFTYSGSGDARELASGTITRISIDVGNDNGSEILGDFVIAGTSELVGSAIDKDDPRSFWNEALKGNDTFNLLGLNAAEVGSNSNTIFGDDLASVTSRFAGITDGAATTRSSAATTSSP